MRWWIWLVILNFFMTVLFVLMFIEAKRLEISWVAYVGGAVMIVFEVWIGLRYNLNDNVGVL